MPLQCNFEYSNPKHKVCIQGCAIYLSPTLQMFIVLTFLTHACGNSRFSLLEGFHSVLKSNKVDADHAKARLAEGEPCYAVHGTLKTAL